MKLTRLLAGASLAALTFTVASCADSSPTAPPAATLAPGDSAELLGILTGTLQRTGLLSCSALPAESVTRTIGRWGGVIEVGPHVLRIPAFALDGPVTITASIPANSRVNRVEFQPHGLQFDRSAALTMSYANCNLLGQLAPKRVAYINGNLQILEYLLSLDNLWRRQVTGRVDHFSEYAVAW